MYDESIRTLAMTPQSFGMLGCCVGMGLQSVPGAPFSGTSTRAGDLLTVRAKGVSPDNRINGAGRIYVCLVVESLIECREGSIPVLDKRVQTCFEAVSV